MRRRYWAVISLIIVFGLLLAVTFNVASGKNNAQALGDEVHAGTFEEPRLIAEPAWPGAVFLDVDAQPPRFYVAAFDSEPETPNPTFPEAAQSSESWTYAGEHSGVGPDLKPFTEPTRVDALHLAQIDGKKALLRSKIEGTPSAQTPYPTNAESNDFWEFIGFFEKSGTDSDMKTEQDLVWPGVFMERLPSKTVYVALRTGNPVADDWPAPDSEAGAGFWKFAGTHSGIPAGFPKPWVDRSVQVNSYYHQPVTAVRNYYWLSKFIGFPVLLDAQFPTRGQSDDFWVYQGRHIGSQLDPKAFGEVHSGGEQFRAHIEGKWVLLHPRFEGTPSAETPYPVELKANNFWTLGDISIHAGTWQNPKNEEDSFAHAGDVYAQQLSAGRKMYRSVKGGYAPEQGWDYSDTQQWQPLGNSQHAGTVADPKIQTELTWPGAVHAATLDEQPVYFISMVEGVPSDHDWPLPVTAVSNEYWTLIPEVKPLGTFEQPRRFEDYSQMGSVYVDSVGVGQRKFYISYFEGYPADDIDSFAMAGEGDPNWRFAGRHSGLMTDLKPFNDVTRIGAFHDAMIAGRDRAVVRSRFDGMPSAATPYPSTPVSTAHWEFVGIFKHSGTGEDMKGRDELTWPGALHLDDAQQNIYAAKKSGVPEAEGWRYPTGAVSDDNWDYVASVGGPGGENGTVQAPRERNSLSFPGTVFADQRGLLRQKLYRSKFTGFAKEVGATYPSGSDSNEFYDYLGEHAGTFTDPKPFDEPTWQDAIHQTSIEGQLVFFKAKFDGAPSADTPYPETLVSNEHWEFLFTTAQAGTYVDPKNMSGTTWPGAIHQYRVLVGDALFRAKQFGNPEAQAWPAPTDPSGEYWEHVGAIRHKGTFADPKEFTEATGVGLVHISTIDGSLVYFRSLVNGVPSENDWAYPVTETSNEYWEYLGKNEPAGTWADPKGAKDFTRPGLIHAVRIGDKLVYIGSKVDGLPAEHDWPYPDAEDNAYWYIAGESLHSGNFADPKDQQEVTWVGAIHMRAEGGVRRYYRSKVAGNLVDSGDTYVLPEGENSNSNWEYVGANSKAGSLSDPHLGAVLTWPGNIHKLTRDNTDAYYMARFSGVSDSSHPMPATGASNDDWAFTGKSSMPGTVLEPKDEHEITWPDAVHRFERDGKVYYVKSSIHGVPPESGWAFPASPVGDESWDIMDVGVHAGTWSDPKAGDDPTWPGAIHVAKLYVHVGDFLAVRRWFYRSKMWGHVSDHEGGFKNPEFFDDVGYSFNMGTLDNPKYFDQPTWLGAIHLDRATKFLFEAKKSGEMGIDVGAHPDTATDNASWRYLGEQRNSGTLEDPKEWNEYTWAGRIHNYDIGRTVLYFSARMTGTPSDHNWYYPTDESSNDHWAYVGRTEHAGTFGDPHEWSEVTWPGAIHRVVLATGLRFFAAKFTGSGQENQWHYPTGNVDNEHWKYVASSVHAGTIEDPKSYLNREPVWPGQIVVDTPVPAGARYFIAKNDGLPFDNNWTLPAGEVSNENWEYFGTSRHTGSQSDPKEWDEVTWPGAFHFNAFDGIRALFRSIHAGIPSDNGWYYPQTLAGNNDNWLWTGIYTHTNGTWAQPKAFNHITEPGKLHQARLSYQNMVFAAKFTGQADPPDRLPSQPVKSFPQGAHDNEWWQFMRKGDGTADTPNGWADYSLVGDTNEYFYGGKRLLFRAKQEGRPSSENRYYPTSEVDNSSWQYLFSHRGTFDDPKDWSEFTVKGDYHRYLNSGKTLFFKAKKDGYPTSLGYYPTVPDQHTESWAYAGLHAGTRQDPKGKGEPTWPGAIHWYREKDLYFASKVSGVPASTWYYPTTPTSNSWWQFVDTGRFTAPYINDFSKPFDEYTWVTAHNAYRDDLGTQLRRGVRGFMIDIHKDGSPTPQVRMCHWDSSECVGAQFLADGFRQIVNFLNSDSNAVVSILFESTVQYADMKNVLEQVPELARYSYNRNELVAPAGGQFDQWPTLQAMIDTDKRLVMFSDKDTPGVYAIGDNRVSIFFSPANQVENTYNLGNTAATHDWSCTSRYSDLALSLRKGDGAMNRPFVLNQFHAWGSSAAHAGDKDNNLTWLQRRVERNCGKPTGWRKPNYLAIDFNQVGDAFPYAGALSQGGFYMYEGNGADRDRDTVCVLPGGQSSPGGGTQYDLKLPTRGCEKDEIRSMELDGISAGTRIEFYDNADADRQDDFTIIDVKQSVPLGQRVRIDSLEGSADTFWYRKMAFHNNGLDGKTSRIIVRRTPAQDDFSDALVVFKEGNGGKESTVCTVPFNTKIETQLGAGNNSFGCDNDEIRSAIIVKAKSGSAIVVTGHPKGNQTQGLTAIKFKRDVLLPITIGSFNRVHETDDYTMEVVGGGNLDGRISHMRVLVDGH